jgi:hypothetical protein
MFNTDNIMIFIGAVSLVAGFITYIISLLFKRGVKAQKFKEVETKVQDFDTQQKENALNFAEHRKQMAVITEKLINFGEKMERDKHESEERSKRDREEFIERIKREREESEKRSESFKIATEERSKRDKEESEKRSESFKIAAEERSKRDKEEFIERIRHEREEAEKRSESIKIAAEERSRRDREEFKERSERDRKEFEERCENFKKEAEERSKRDKEEAEERSRRDKEEFENRDKALTQSILKLKRSVNKIYVKVSKLQEDVKVESVLTNEKLTQFKEKFEEQDKKNIIHDDKFTDMYEKFWGITKVNSPKVLTDTGLELLIISGGKDCIDKNKEFFIQEVEKYNPTHPYDVEKISYRVINIYSTDPIYNEIKSFIYLSPKEMELAGNKVPIDTTIISIVMGVYLRDFYLEKHSELNDILKLPNALSN